MAKTKKAALVHDAGSVVEAGPGITRTWADNHACYITGRSFIDEADAAAIEMESKWGADRLRLLVTPELREKFDRQRYLFNQAIWHGDLEAVKRESGRMTKAWRALDARASQEGRQPRPPEVWEVALSDGTVAALVPDNASARHVLVEGRCLHVYTLDEIARLLEGYPGLAKIKAAFPGATVTTVKRSVPDPLESVGDTRDSLEDAIPF